MLKKIEPTLASNNWKRLTFLVFLNLPVKQELQNIQREKEGVGNDVTSHQQF